MARGRPRGSSDPSGPFPLRAVSLPLGHRRDTSSAASGFHSTDDSRRLPTTSAHPPRRYQHCLLRRRLGTQLSALRMAAPATQPSNGTTNRPRNTVGLDTSAPSRPLYGPWVLASARRTPSRRTSRKLACGTARRCTWAIGPPTQCAGMVGQQVQQGVYPAQIRRSSRTLEPPSVGSASAQSPGRRRTAFRHPRSPISSVRRSIREYILTRELSPRVRGRPDRADGRVVGSGAIPACAGTAPSPRPGVSRSSGRPRACVYSSQEIDTPDTPGTSALCTQGDQTRTSRC